MNAISPRMAQFRRRIRVRPLTPAIIAAFEFRTAAEQSAVVESAGPLLAGPEWAHAIYLDDRVAIIGGYVWASQHYCMSAFAQAAWVRPMHWRCLLPAIGGTIERARAAGAVRIEALVSGYNREAIRVLLTLGFMFCGTQYGRDGDSDTPWLTFAIAPTPNAVIGVAMAEAALKIMHECGDR